MFQLVTFGFLSNTEIHRPGVQALEYILTFWYLGGEEDPMDKTYYVGILFCTQKVIKVQQV